MSPQLLRLPPSTQHRRQHRLRPSGRQNQHPALLTVHYLVLLLAAAASICDVSCSSSGEGAGNSLPTTSAPSAARNSTPPAATAAAGDSGQAPCESTVLPEVPPSPYYDASEPTETAARQLANFLSSGGASQRATELRRRAQSIANQALQADEGLLAVALAAPAHKVAVVQFRDHVEMAVNSTQTSSGGGAGNAAANHSYLGIYWRELGEAWNRSDGAQAWGAPFRDCGPMQGRWLWPFSATVQVGGYKTVASAFIAADDDQCNDSLEPVFGKRHVCDPTTTFCLQSIPNGSLTSRGAYTCFCRFGFHRPGHELQGYDGAQLEAASLDGSLNGTCEPCPGGCSACDQHGECFEAGDTTDTVSRERLLQLTVSTVLGAAVLICLGLSIIVYRQRKCRTISNGMWTILETIILGVVLMYAAVALHLMQASTWRCLLEPWCRELGFIICYGAIILKLYRHLVEFRTRKAHRWVLRDVDLLKYLSTMTFAVVCYMAAFTASAWDLMEAAGLEGGLREEITNTCRPQRWEYVTQVAEMCVLAFGVHLAVASRNANTQFRERQFLVASILIEFLVSSSYYLLRLFYLQHLSPGAIFVALFVRSLLTNTVTLGLVFLPKFWYQQKQGRSHLAHDLSCRLPVMDAFKGAHETAQNYANVSSADPELGELSIADMNPEEIRAEFKRLYTELELLKNKTMCLDNPHISKRRGGRKAAHRRFSLQALSAKHRGCSGAGGGGASGSGGGGSGSGGGGGGGGGHRSNQTAADKETTEAEASQTPEESVCSVDGPTEVHGGISGGELSATANAAASK